MWILGLKGLIQTLSMGLSVSILILLAGLDCM